MARAKRCFIDNGIYHILNRGNGKQQVFFKDADYGTFMELLMESKARYSSKIYAYCLMPNHFHFVAQCPKAECYSDWMHWITTTHVVRYHRHYGGSGHVWQGRFKSFLIQENEYFYRALRYVEANPLRAGLVRSSSQWAWSSLHERFHKANSKKFLDDPPLVLPSFWEEWVNQDIDGSELKGIRNSVNRQVPYGIAGWQEKICTSLGMESLLRPLGRPKKGA